MAELVSPGVQVTVTDESFTAGGGPGTVPLIIVATAQDKSSPDGLGVAEFTTLAEAGEVKLITSQRQLLGGYGNPDFKTSGGTPLHGNELNEYGLQAAFSYLGISNRAYVLRADIDLDQLEGSFTPPTSAPADGTYWLDTTSSALGIKEWDGTNWVAQPVSILDPLQTLRTGPDTVRPRPSAGVEGSFAAVVADPDGTTLDQIVIWEKINGVWFVVGSSDWSVNKASADFQVAPHTALPISRSDSSSLASGDVMLQTTAPNNGTVLDVKVYDSVSRQFVTETVVNREFSYEVYAVYTAAGGISEGDLWADFESDRAVIEIKRHNGQDEFVVATYPSEILDQEIPELVLLNGSNVALRVVVNNNDVQSGNTAIFDITVTDSGPGSNVTYSDFLDQFSASLGAADPLAQASDLEVRANGTSVEIVSRNGRNVFFEPAEIVGFGPGSVFIGDESSDTDPVTLSNFEELSYQASADELVGGVTEGALWYDSLVSNDNIDILYNNNGTWETYFGDINVVASEPTTQSDGTPLEVGDLWISSADLENYPQVFKYSGTAWVQVDTTDGETADGMVFADVRANSGAPFDDDAPQSSLFPFGILVWNKRGSGGNVKQWDSVNARWVDYSGNKADGSPYMLRKAQRRAVVRALQAAVASNTDIRNEGNRFNLIACPGYPELLDEMVTLNVDRKETAFIVGDTPLRLSADATELQAWATNQNNASETGEDGLVTRYVYSGIYYPPGLTSNIDGNNIVVPASTLALRTLAFNDQVAFPWFAPAGFQRGIVTNASSVGFIDADSAEYVPVSLSEGQRDSLYLNNVNPIGSFPNRGLAVFGQKTLSPNASALDRINVARLVVFIRERLDDIVKPFLFEPNDEITRQNAKVVVDRFLGNLVSQRGLFDFVTVVDTSNNTPDRIDRNELWIDIAIQPTRAVEFIYIPIRVQNTLGSNN